MVLIVMGVSGCGKSTVGRLLGERLGWSFRDGDEFHPPGNVAKMRAGVPLDDHDRSPWLFAIQTFMRQTQADGQNAVIACSALKEKYRDVLLRREPWVRFVHLHGSRELLTRRLLARKHDYMPASLLDSQLTTLESPADALVLDIAEPPDRLVEQIIAALALPRAATATDSP